MARSKLLNDTVSDNKSLHVFIIGITGKVGGLLAQKLLSKGDTVHGLVRRDEQRADFAAQGMDAVVGDLSNMAVEELAAAFGNADVIVFSAGSNGGSMGDTMAIDDHASQKRSKQLARQESTVLRWFQYSLSLGVSGTLATKWSITLQRRRKQTSRLVVVI